MSYRGETLGQTQDLLERLYVSTGLDPVFAQMSWNRCSGWGKSRFLCLECLSLILPRHGRIKDKLMEEKKIVPNIYQLYLYHLCLLIP